jgi:outer membrane lipoprotein-sorting protein
MKKFFSILALVAALGIVSACTQQAKSSGDSGAVAPAPEAAPQAAPSSCGGGGGCGGGKG